WRESRMGTLFWIATVREGINRLLPAANIGGELVGIRLLAERGVDGVHAAASVTTEVVLTIASQYVFVLIGVLCLLRLTDTVQFADDVLIGLAASLPIVVLLAVLLRYGSVFERMERLAVRLLGEQALPFLAGQSASLDAAIRELCSDRPRHDHRLAGDRHGRRLARGLARAALARASSALRRGDRARESDHDHAQFRF